MTDQTFWQIASGQLIIQIHTIVTITNVYINELSFFTGRGGRLFVMADHQILHSQCLPFMMKYDVMIFSVAFFSQ